MLGGDPQVSGLEDPDEFGFETRAIRAGQPHDPYSGAVRVAAELDAAGCDFGS